MFRAKHLLLIVTLMSGLSAVGLTRISFEGDVAQLVKSDSRDARFLQEILTQFDRTQNEFIFIVESSDLFTPEPFDDLCQFVAKVSAMPNTKQVLSLANARFVLVENFLPRFIVPDMHASRETLRQAREDCLNHDVLRAFLSPDANTTFVSVRMNRTDLSLSEIVQTAEQMRQLAREYEQAGRLRIQLTGRPIVEAESIRMVEQETIRLSVIAVVLSTALALAIFRDVRLTLIACLAPLTGVLWTLGVLGLAGEQLNAMTSVLPVLVLTVGFTDSVHIVLRMHVERQKCPVTEFAVHAAVRDLAFPCMLTSLTTAISFGSLALTQNDVLCRFGISCAVGTGCAFFAVLLVSPLLGFALIRNRTGSCRDVEPSFLPAHKAEAIFSRVSAGRWAISMLGITCTLILIPGVSKLQPDFQVTELLSNDGETKTAVQHFDREFGGIHTAFVVVDWPAECQPYTAQFRHIMAAVEDACRKERRVQYPLSIMTLSDSMPGGIAQFIPAELSRSFIRPDLRRTIIPFRYSDSHESLPDEEFESLKASLQSVEEKFPACDIHLTGSHLVMSQQIRIVIADLAKSLAGTLIVIFLVLIAAFRSVWLACLSLIPNVLPMLIAASVLVWIDEPLRIANVVAFSIFLGIAFDDTIHFLSQFVRELQIDGQTQASVRRSFTAVASPLILTTVVIVLAFGIVGFGKLPHNRVFACLGCTAMIAALVGDLILLPAMLMCFLPRTFHLPDNKTRPIFHETGPHER